MNKELYRTALEIIKEGEKKTMLPPYQPEQGHYHEIIGTETDKVHLDIRFIGSFCSYEYTFRLENNLSRPKEIFRFVDERQEKAAEILAEYLEA